MWQSKVNWYFENKGPQSKWIYYNLNIISHFCGIQLIHEEHILLLKDFHLKKYFFLWLIKIFVPVI